MHANLHPEAAQCGSAGSADLASAARTTECSTARFHNAARTLSTIGLSLLLSACALPRMIDSQVQSFSGATAATTNASYRFERLPSQQSPQQDAVEGMAQTALQEVGLQLANGPDTKPRYSVQVEAQAMPFQPAPRRPVRPIAPFVTADGIPIFSPMMVLSEPPWYEHTTHFVLRDLSTGLIAFETTGRFEGPWSDTPLLWPVVMRAALTGYPNPPSGVRTVTIELPATKTPSP